jgi:hypothetical protein
VDEGFFQHEDRQAAAGQDTGERAARDPGSDDHDIRFFRHRSFLPIRHG